MNYSSYKNRFIDFTKQVKIYKNLHNGLFSVLQGGLVVAHIESFALHSVTFKVNESGRQRVIKERKKNVHAFICGLLVDVNKGFMHDRLSPISYNPYKASNFYFKRGDDFNEVLLHDFEIVQGDSKQGLFLVD